MSLLARTNHKKGQIIHRDVPGRWKKMCKQPKVWTALWSLSCSRKRTYKKNIKNHQKLNSAGTAVAFNLSKKKYIFTYLFIYIFYSFIYFIFLFKAVKTCTVIPYHSVEVHDPDGRNENILSLKSLCGI